MVVVTFLQMTRAVRMFDNARSNLSLAALHQLIIVMTMVR